MATDLRVDTHRSIRWPSHTHWIHDSKDEKNETWHKVDLKFASLRDGKRTKVDKNR